MELLFPMAALTVLCFAAVASKVLVIAASALAEQGWHSSTASSMSLPPQKTGDRQDLGRQHRIIDPK